MAYSTQPIRPIHFIAGGSAFALLLFLTLGTVIAVWLRAEFGSGLAPSDWAAIRFTLFQAFLSAGISILVAVPLARALARQKFLGRNAVLALMGAPFILPAIVAVLGILAVWGRGGYINSLLEFYGLAEVNIFGLTGVVLAHVFFNIPLATRLILQGWLSIPAEHFRVAAQLGMSSKQVSKHLEWPMLKAVLPGAFLIIFLLCITSFAVVLGLGGGPKATTIELAIYQAVRFEFDLAKAAQLAVIQFLLCAFVALLSIWLSSPMQFDRGLDRPLERYDGTDLVQKMADCAIIIGICTFLFLPLIAVFTRGFLPLFALSFDVWVAALRSVFVALLSSALCILLAIALSAFFIRIARRRKAVSNLMEALSFLTLASSPFVMGTGLFILIFPFISPFEVAFPLTALVNAAMALPFALRVLLPAMTRAEEHYGKLADSVGLERWARFRIAIWPRLKRPAGFSAGLAAALSMGDLGVVTLFAPAEAATLPLMMYRLLASYQMDAAAGAALLLVVLSVALFWIFDQGGRYGHHT